MIWYSYDPGTKSLVLSAHGKLLGQPSTLQMISGSAPNGFAYCFAVCSPGSGPRLPARRPRPPMVRSHGLPDSAEDDHRTRSTSTDNLVLPPLEGLRENRSPASSSVGRMARAIAKAMALPRRLPLGCQRRSLYLPRRRAKKGQWPDGGISVEFATTIEAEATLLSIYGTRASPVAILSKRAAAIHTKPIALSVRRRTRAC